MPAKKLLTKFLLIFSVFSASFCGIKDEYNGIVHGKRKNTTARNIRDCADGLVIGTIFFMLGTSLKSQNNLIVSSIGSVLVACTGGAINMTGTFA